MRAVAGDVYDLLSVTIEFFEPSGELGTSISAASARVQARLAESGFELEESHENVLSDVEAVLHTGTPLAPLRVRVPSLSLRLDDQRLASDSEVLIEGRGLSITGEGLTIDREAETVEIQREPLVRMRFEDGSRAVLEGRRSLRIAARGLGDQRTVELVAGEARLDFDTGAPARLSAETIRLVGSAVQDQAPVADPEQEETRFTPHDVEALGRATIVTADGVFEGDRGELAFDAAGAAERAVLVGAPRLRVDLSDVELGDLAELETAPGELGLEASGAGPLEVLLGAAPSVSFAGPVELRMPSIDLRVDARSGVSGSRDPTGERLVLSIRGEVVVTHGAATLTAPELVIDSLVDERGRRSARLTSPGPTRTQGQLADGSPFELVTAGTLSVERGAEGFRVPRAEGIELDVRGDKPFVARADALRDFVEEPLALVAEGHVRFASQAGEGSAEQLQVVDPEHVVLTGTPGEPARFDLETGWLEAQSIELAGAELTARDGAVVRYEVEGADYDLRSDFARIDRSGWLEGQESEGLVLLDALGSVVVSVRSAEGWSAEVASDRLRVKAIEPVPPAAPTAAPERLEPLELTAEGHVRFGYAADFDLRGAGERLVLRADGSGELRPLPGERLELDGHLPKDDTTFSMSCRTAEFSSKHLIAEDPDLRAQGPGVELGGSLPSGGRLRAVAGRMASDETSILLTGGAHISQAGSEGTEWFLYADKVLLTGTPEAREQPTLETFRDLLAWDGFVASFGGELRATGDSLQLLRESETLRLAGDPAVIELPAFQWAATRFELDLDHRRRARRAGLAAEQRVDAGVVAPELLLDRAGDLPRRDDPGHSRAGDRLARRGAARLLGPVLDRQPRMAEHEPRRPGRRGADRGAAARDHAAPSAAPRQPLRAHPSRGRRRVAARDLLRGQRLLLQGGRRMARVDSIYLDLVDGHGWIRDIDLAIDLPFMEGRPLKLRAQWMRHSADGSFFASDAVATTCDHEEPHYVVRIGDLRIDPRKKERKRKPSDGPGEGPVVEDDGWEISTRNTSLGLSNQLEVPLPRLALPVTPDLQLDTERLSLGGMHPLRFGSDSKLGTFVGTTVRRELGWLAEGVHKLLLRAEAPEIDLDGQTDYRASWNNDRGLLLGLTSELGGRGPLLGPVRHRRPVRQRRRRGPDPGSRGGPQRVARLVPHARALLDRRGRVARPGRDGADGRRRAVGVLRERVPRVRGARVLPALAPGQRPRLPGRHRRGVPQRLPERDRHPGSAARAHAQRHRRTDRRDPVALQLGLLVRLPAARDRRPEHPLALRRALPVHRLPPPGGGDTSDGWGEEQTLRFDTSQRLEAPVALGFAGLRATPFVEARGTAWQIGADVNSKTGAVSAEDPTRIALLGGAELGTAFWRRFPGGVRHLVAPFIGFRADLFLEDEGEPLVPFDQVENPIDGRFFDLGVRNRLESKLSGSYLDVELVETYAEEAADGTITGWLPLEVNAKALTRLGSVDVGITHDALYDLETDLTPYSRTIFGVDPLPNIGVEMGYHSARDQAGQSLYNALSAGALYALSAKWEIEGRYVFSTQGDGRLSSEFELRRLGHDFVFQVSTRFQEGEGGGTSFQFDVIPLVTYDAPGDSLVERWRERRY